MSTADNRALVERWYAALAVGDFATIEALHHEDVVYNMVGNTPASGARQPALRFAALLQSRETLIEVG